MNRAIWVLSIALISASITLTAQPQSPAPADTAAEPDDREKQKEKDDGIPVTSEVVKKSCGGCHTLDDKQRMIANLLPPHHA